MSTINNYKKFLLNGLILTATSFFLRWTGVLFNSYISKKLGSEGMGIYTLVQTLFGFAVTFACSGINLGTTRLVSEALARGRVREAKTAIKKCVIYSLSFSLTALAFLYIGANFLGCKILGDPRTVKSIRILSLSLPFVSLSSVFNGYFSAARKAYKSASVIFIEQFACISITVKTLSLLLGKGLEFACVSVAIGTFIAEAISLAFNIILYALDIWKLKIQNTRVNKQLSKKLFKISLPLALSTYVRSGLVTVEHLLIPYGLRKNGATLASSLSSYGLIQGMVFPVIMFPSSIIYSFAGLVVPELSRYNELNDKSKINRAVTIILRYSLLYSIGMAGIITCFSYEISLVFFGNAEAHSYIKLFAPLITIMYLDGAVDSILKGLNEQLYSMKINIADAFLSVILVYTLIPKFGIKGYIIAIFVCEIFNCCMSMLRLVKICSPTFYVGKFIFGPITNVIISTAAITLIFKFLDITYFTSATNLVLRIICVLMLYVILSSPRILREKSSDTSDCVM